VGKTSLVFWLVAIISSSLIAGETNGLNRIDRLIWDGADSFSKGDLDKAIAEFSAAIRLDPSNSLALFDRAGAYRAKGELEKSVEDLNKYILLNPTNDLAFKGRAAVFDAKGEFDKAISDWSEGLRLNPNDATALAMRGQCYYSTGRFNEALKDYHRAINLDPNNEIAWNNLGWLRATCPVASIRDGKEAIEAATKACEFSKWLKWTRIDSLAAAFAEAGDFQQAIKYQKLALGMGGVTDKDRDGMQNRLSLYEQRQPYRQTKP
jgi:tetratricopeptide (TPR) repeat protein